MRFVNFQNRRDNCLSFVVDGYPEELIALADASQERNDFPARVDLVWPQVFDSVSSIKSHVCKRRGLYASQYFTHNFACVTSLSFSWFRLDSV
jgi:hypothetical protein